MMVIDQRLEDMILSGDPELIGLADAVLLTEESRLYKLESLGIVVNYPASLYSKIAVMVRVRITFEKMKREVITKQEWKQKQERY